MKKKILSIALAAALTASMATVAAVSASAAIDSNGCYTPSEGTETNRYYFFLPSDWLSSYTEATGNTAGIYWWEGTDACGAADGSNPDSPAWPGYKAQYEGTYEIDEYNTGSVYYVDCPADVTTIIWNNYLDGGDRSLNEDGTYTYATSEEQYVAAIQSQNIGSEYYDAGESDLYPDGTTSFDNMIYVIDPTKTTINEFNGKVNCSGEWYYYYGDGKYGTSPEEADAAEVYDTAYQPAKTADTPEATTAPADNSGEETTTVAAAEEGTTNAPATDAKSSTSDTAKSSSSTNGAIQTGEASMAVIALVIIAGAVGVVMFARKKYSK